MDNKIIQIAVIAETINAYETIYALKKDGSVWFKQYDSDNGKWEKWKKLVDE